MQVRRVSFVGVRTTAFDATVGLFRDVLGMEPAFTNPGWAGFRLPSGERDLLEVFGRADIDTRVVPPELEHGVLIALAVDDVDTAREELAAAGAPNGWPPGCLTSSSKKPSTATTGSSPLDLSEVAVDAQPAQSPVWW